MKTHLPCTPPARHRRGHALAAALWALLALSPATAQTGPQPPLPTVRLTAGIHVVQAEVATAPDERAAGLMFRKEMAANAGMLFGFEQPAVHCFWMRNTVLPLSIAFIADDGSIVNIADMQPQTTESHCAEKPVRFALEMNQGWFTKRGLKPGSRLQGGPFGKAPS
jgi:uncharacterized membrane protein (UPF0127 family)